MVDARTAVLHHWASATDEPGSAFGDRVLNAAYTKMQDALDEELRPAPRTPERDDLRVTSVLLTLRRLDPSAATRNFIEVIVSVFDTVNTPPPGDPIGLRTLADAYAAAAEGIGSPSGALATVAGLLGTYSTTLGKLQHRWRVLWDELHETWYDATQTGAIDLPAPPAPGDPALNDKLAGLMAEAVSIYETAESVQQALLRSLAEVSI